MREVKDSPGPGHDGNGGVVVSPFYAQGKQHQPPNQQGHPPLGPPHPLARPAPPGMRGSPVPPGVSSNNPPPHMSSAVGAPSNMMSSHPGSNQSEGNPRMHAAGYPPGNPHIPGAPPGAHPGYPSKMGHMATGPSGPGYGQPGFQHPPSHQYPGSRAPTHMMQPYPQGFPPGSQPGSQGPPSSMPPGHQYPPRPPPNQSFAYPHFSQPSWTGQGPPASVMSGGPSMLSGGPGMQNKPPSHMPVQPSQAGVNNIGGRRPHTPPLYMKAQMQHKMVGYPGAGHQMYPNGPSMPPMMNNRDSMPPPPSTSQPLIDGENHSSGVVNSISNNIPNNINSSNPTQIGPDGNPVVDEGSQTSTVSNNSATSDDRSTPKPHKEPIIMGQPMGGPPVGMQNTPQLMQHPPTPKNCASSPGTTSVNSQIDENEGLSSPCWPRSPAAPTAYVNNQPPPPPPEVFRTTKAGDSLMRLYEMSDSPERKVWLDKLLRFMEEHKTPITTCPTISKNPLDLYNLYLHVREKGGFEEITRNKQWKDVAAVMGIGASSSGSYTLRKHYMKHILSYECKYDRGGIDPQPIINQIESTQKKKTTKSISVPSPAGSNSSSMDGFTNGPHMPGGPGMGSPYPPYPPSSEYSGHMQQRPSNQPGSGYQGMPGGQYPGYQVMHGPYGSSGYPNAGFNPERGYQPTAPSGGGYGYQQPPGYPRPPYPPAQQSYPPDQYGTMANSSSTGSYGNSQLARQLLNPPRNPVPINQPYQSNSMYPSKPGPSPSPGPQPPPATPGQYPQPRRHPDFDKAQTWRPPNSQFPPGFGGPQNQGPIPPQQPWSRPNDSAPPSAPPQWSQQPRYQPQPPQSFPNQQQWTSSAYSGPQRKPTPAPGQKVYPLNQTSFKSTGYGTYMGKQLFPMDSVEAVSPVLIKRRRMGKTDLSPIDPWRILMSLRCGMASEVTWAIDILNILLFDDRSVVYFGINDMPGMLEVLIEHLRRGLINMFNICTELELGRDDEATGANKRIKAELSDGLDHPWYLARPISPGLELDLGTSDDNFICHDKEMILNGEDFTFTTRTRKMVKISKRETALFVKDGTRDWDKWEGFDSGIDTWSVGGGECTAHLICSMQSSVSTLPFTRLLTTIKKSTCGEIKTEPSDVETTVEISPPTPIEPNLEEKTDVKPSQIESTKEDAGETNQPCPEMTPQENLIEEKLSPKECLSALNEDEDKRLSSKATAPKEIKSIFGLKQNRKGSSKSLDEILKRIKGTGGSFLSNKQIFDKNKNTPDNDSKSILDHYLVKNLSTNQHSSSESREDQLIPEQTLKPVVKSPTKLPSLSPIKIGEKAESNRSSTGSRRDSSGFKRPYEDLEEESWGPDDASLSTTTEGQDWLARRVIAVGTVIRNLSFIPGNEDAMSKNAPLLALLGKTILLHHSHPSRFANTANYDKDEEIDMSDWCSSLAPDTYWWWPYLNHVHDNTLVTLANIAGYLDLSYYPEEISRPILNGLLHWATCPASYGQDPLPGAGLSPASSLSPQRLAVEALVKLCVLDSNTDLVLATPPFSRLDMLCSQLTRLLSNTQDQMLFSMGDQVLREFSINLFHYFSAADSGVARVIAMQNGCVSLLTTFIEEAETNAMNVANIQGVAALKENPELMGTSLDMVRRAANTLVNLSRVPDNARVLASCENRLLTLVMSQILDTYVASQLSQVLFNVAQTNEDSLPDASASPIVDEGSCKDFYPLISKEFDSLTMESLRNIENKNKAIHVIPEKDAEPKKDDSEADRLTSSLEPQNNRAAEVVPPNQESASYSGPSSPSSLASHPSVSPNPLQRQCIVESSIPSSNITLKCSPTPSGVGTKVAPQVTPTL